VQQRGRGREGIERFSHAGCDGDLAETAVSKAPARPSAGCNGTAALMPGASTHSISVGGTERTYRRYLPDDGRQGPRPLVINLHGLSSNADQQAVPSAFERLATQEQFITLTPQGD
jgi:polyhydroxybutyrate depolymerase